MPDVFLKLRNANRKVLVVAEAEVPAEVRNSGKRLLEEVKNGNVECSFIRLCGTKS